MRPCLIWKMTTIMVIKEIENRLGAARLASAYQRQPLLELVAGHRFASFRRADGPDEMVGEPTSATGPILLFDVWFFAVHSFVL